MVMDHVLTGTVRGNTIVLDHPLSVPDGQAVEVVVRDRLSPPPVPPTRGDADSKPPAWWTKEDDEILEEIYQARKRSTRPEVEQ